MDTLEQRDYAKAQTVATLKPLSQTLVTLSVADREALLLKASQEVYGRKDEAAAILDRLQQLNPQVASHFSPKSNAISELPLRMICSQKPEPSSSSSSSSGSIKSFIVVSYSWHYPSWKLAPAAKPIVPGWEISQPMVDAIMGLREDSDEGVWLDRLCIDQNDDRDKDVHIGAMGIIYRSARRLIILFEDIQLTKDESEAGVIYAGFYEEMCGEISDRKLEGREKSEFIHSYLPLREKTQQEEGKGYLSQAFRPFLMKMLSSRWYSRAWCAHESRVVAHESVNNPLILCFGHDGQVLAFEFRFLFMLSNIYERQDLVSANNRSFLDILDLDNGTLSAAKLRMQRTVPYGDADTCLMEHLASILQFGCFHKGDLVSIALNTSGIPLCFHGQDQIKTEEDIIWVFSILTLAAGDVLPLVTDDDRLKFVDGDGEISISWATRPGPFFHGKKLATPLVNSITAATREYLELDLLVFPTVPSEPSITSWITALDIIEKYNLVDLATELTLTPSSDLVGENELTRNLQAQLNYHRSHGADPSRLLKKLCSWLACGLDNGLAWMVRFSENMRRSTETEEQLWNTGTLGADADARAVDAAVALFWLFHPTTTTGDTQTHAHTAGTGTALMKSNPQEDKGESERICDIIIQLTQFLTILIDPRLSDFSSLDSPCRLPFLVRSSSGSNGDLLPSDIDGRDDPNAEPQPTTNSKQHKNKMQPDWVRDCTITPSTNSHTFIAVPAALAHLPAWRKRAWLVEPFDLSKGDPAGREGGLDRVFEEGETCWGAYPFFFPTSEEEENKIWAWRVWRTQGICGGGDLGLYCETLNNSDPEFGRPKTEEVVLLRKQRVYTAEGSDMERTLKNLKKQREREELENEKGVLRNLEEENKRLKKLKKRLQARLRKQD